jgi:putative oxidoreductase
MTLNRYGGPILSLFRIVVGLLFTFHGAATMFGIFGGHRGSGQAAEFAAWPHWWAALIQLLCGALVLTGLFTRVAALIASGSMAYAYFIVHQPQDLLPLLNGGELAAMFCWAFFLISVLGPGPWALDTLFRRPSGTTATGSPDDAPLGAPAGGFPAKGAGGGV